MRTAGLDALIFHRAFTLGVLFFTPVTTLALCACQPLPPQASLFLTLNALNLTGHANL